MRSSVPGGKPGPLSATRDAAATCRRPMARDRDRRPRRRVAGGVLQQIDEHLLQQQAIDEDQRQVGGQPHARPRAPSSSRRVRCKAEPTISSRTCHCLFGVAAPASSLDIWRMFSSSRFSRAASSAIVSSSCRRVSSSSDVASSRLLLAPAIAASGVFRSCDTLLSSVLRTCSASA